MESLRHSGSSERALGEGLEAYASGIDAMVVIGHGEDLEIYEETFTYTNHR